MSETTIVDTPHSRHFPNLRPTLKAGPGRPKGSVDILPREVKRAMAEVYRLKGGEFGMKQWADENPDKFYELLIRCNVTKPKDDEESEGMATVHVHFLITDTKDAKAIDVSPDKQSLSVVKQPTTK